MGNASDLRIAATHMSYLVGWRKIWTLSLFRTDLYSKVVWRAAQVAPSWT